MVVTIILILMLLWLLGLLGHIGGGVIWLLLILALVVYIFDRLNNRR